MVGVCIKYMHENYGGILQAYATVSYLENQNIEYELVRYTRKKTVTEALKDVPRLFNAVWFNSRFEGIQRKISLKKHPEYAKNNEVRMKAFAGFKKWAFKDFSDEYIGYAALREGGKKYSAVITGSDQLWSPAGLPTNYYNLMFVPDDTLKISIASSFGVKEIPWYQKKRTIQYLNRIEYISMRENLFKLFAAACFGIVACMPFVFPILINEKYVAGYDQILILMYAMLFRVLVGLYSCIYVAQKNAKKIAYTSISAAIINITVNLILINKIKILLN